VEARDGSSWFLQRAGVPGRSVGAEPVARPNFVVILADDLGYGDVACYNPESKIPTPHVDRLAAEGMRFTDAHTPSAVCTPTRYGLLTGRYCWRTRLKYRVLDGFDPPLIEPGQVTVASLLADRGYATACIGKWHLGLQWTRPDGSRYRRFGPPRGRLVPATTSTSPRPFTGGPLGRVPPFLRHLRLAEYVALSATVTGTASCTCPP
jgi:arylsulfatase A